MSIAQGVEMFFFILAAIYQYAIYIFFGLIVVVLLIELVYNWIDDFKEKKKV